MTTTRTNIRDAKLVPVMDERAEPKVNTKGWCYCCGYVEVFAVAPGCFPVAVGALSTSIYRGNLYYNAGSGRKSLDGALEEIRAGITLNHDMRPMSDEILAAICAA